MSEDRMTVLAEPATQEEAQKVAGEMHEVVESARSGFKTTERTSTEFSYDTTGLCVDEIGSLSLHIELLL